MKIALCLLTFIAVCSAQPVLNERILTLANESAYLSTLAYENATEFAILNGSGNVTGFEHPGYEQISFYTEEPDQAIVAKKDGRCFIAFRGTSATASDWEQNLDLREDQLYKNNDNSTGEFCIVRRGYSDFLRTSAFGSAAMTLLSCSQTCTDPTDCVVITGHSQGGASAAVASILAYDLMPTIFTFGMPPAAKEGCTLIPSERLYRFVNHRKEENEVDDLGFDPVPYSPTIFSHSKHYGYYILVGPDKTAAKYLGFDQNYTFTPSLNDRQNEIESHTMAGKNYSYSARIEGLLNTGNTNGFPVSVDGFALGIPCEPNYNELCNSSFCIQNICSPRNETSELCIKGGCEDDEDCLSGRCIYGACAAGDGQVEGGCPCLLNRDCKSGDCDHKASLNHVCEFGESANATKEEQLCIKGSCERDEDCESGFCIWGACAASSDQVEGGCPCQSNGSCKSGDCDTSLSSLDWVCEEATSNGAQTIYLRTMFAAILIGVLSWM